MFEYAVYVRTEEGYINRVDNVISNLPYYPQGTYTEVAPFVWTEFLVS